MDLHYEHGNPDQPKGHALVYFESDTALLATYLVVLPVAIELGKYLPPLLASQMPDIGSASPSVVPIPPMPEQVAGHSFLARLASARDDDLIFGGRISGNPDSIMRVVADIAQSYLNRYHDFTSSLGTDERPAEKEVETELDAREVLYSLMGEHGRLQELSKLTGQLRYALEGQDAKLATDTVVEMERLAKYLPAKYRMVDFLRAAQLRGEQGQRLAALFIDRCYKLYSEDYSAVAQIERELKLLQADS